MMRVGQRIGAWVVTLVLRPHEAEVARADDADALGTLTLAPMHYSDADWADALALAGRVLDQGVDGARRFYVVARARSKGMPPLPGFEMTGFRGTLPAAGQLPAALYWSVRFPDDASVARTRALFVADWYAFELELSADALLPALVRRPIDASKLAGLSITFRVTATNARVRRSGATDAGAEVLASEPAVCGPLGVAPFRVEVAALAAGPTTLAAELIVAGAVMLRDVIELTAVDLASPAPAPPTAARPAPAPALDPDALATTPVALSLSFCEPSAHYRFQIGSASTCDPTILESRRPIADLANTVSNVRRKLAELSRAYRADAETGLAPTDGGAALLELAKQGRELHGLLFGRANDRGSTDLAHAAELFRALGRDGTGPRVQIDGPTVPIPWGILYDAPDNLAAPADVDPLGFWGRRFAIDRIAAARITGVRAPIVAGPIQPCLHPGIDAEQRVTAIRDERAFFASLGAQPIESAPELRAHIANTKMPPSALLYFFCHATAARVGDLLPTTQAAIDQAKLGFGGADGDVTVRALGDLRAAELAGNPLVFLNACESALGDPAYQSEFLTLFVEQWQAAGFVGTDWTVPTVFADAFARRVLQRFLVEREPIGAAFRAVTVDVLARGNPFPLIYALYVRPELRVKEPR